MDVDDPHEHVGMEEEDEELTSDSVILLLKQSPASPSAVAQLSALASSGQLRDYDELFSDTLFYQLSATLLSSCWHAYDVHHSLSSDSQHDLFVLSHSTQRSVRGQSGMDDEEEEMGEESAIGSREQQDSSWLSLQHAYTYTSHLLSAPECDAGLAGQRRAFDGKFLTALMGRIQPKKRKHAAVSIPSTQSGQRPTVQQLQSIVGVGSVSMAGGSAAQQQHLASVPNSILSTVGLGIRAAEPDSPTPAELSLLRGLLHLLYSLLVPQRPLVLSLISAFFQRFLRQPVYPQGIGDLLAVYASIVKGLRLPLLPRHTHWLLQNVLPLHLPNAMQTELTPIIQPFHEQLVYVLVEFLKKDRQQRATLPSPLPVNPSSPSLLLQVLSQVLVAWPTSQQPNSAKEVLLLHEMEKLWEFASLDVFASFAPSFFPYLVAAVASSHHRVSERCLQLWQNDHFLSLINSQRLTLFPQLMPVLLQEKHWNRSVNKMRVVVLETCREQDAALFTRCVHQIFHQASEAECVAQAERLMKEMRPADELQLSEEQKLLQTQALIPSSLPSVAYNEFVFGHLLGEGSFSQVRYAKRIVKGCTASQWPEFAVKVVDRQLIRQQKYEENVEREQRIMAGFHHPNVTSLVGTCSNDHHLYFVLEYAAKGDLHTHIAALGSFSVDTTRFIAAEILRGIQHLHSSHIIWGDCKPENVLVHGSGHVKLTDFGSSRREDEVVEGGRVEGTEDYLAPELLKGGGTSQASDLWAYACVLYQMLEGKTPQWTSEPDVLTKRKKPKLKTKLPAAEQQANSSPSPAFSADRMVQFDSVDSHFSDAFDPDARALISSILAPDPNKRFAVVEGEKGRPRVDYGALMSHPFFAGVDWDRLHTLPAPSLAGGSVAPAPDAKWARRKNSLMWAPMPKAYAFTDSSFVLETIGEDASERTEGSAVQQRSEGARLMHTGFGADTHMTQLEEGDEEGEEDGEGEDLALNGRPWLDIARGADSTNPPTRQSSRVTSTTSRGEVDGGTSAAPPPSHPLTVAGGLGLGLPPRPRLGMKSAPPPRNAGSGAFVPDASPLSGVHVPGITGGQRPLGNPTAASLLSRMLGGAGAARGPQQ